jgi:hypothetical protein
MRCRRRAANRVKAVPLSYLAFNDWIEHAFSHEVRFQRTAWYFDLDCDYWNPAPVEAVDYLTRLFENSGPALRHFSDAQIAQGLTYLVSTSASGDNGWLYSTDVPIAMRLRCIEAVATLFSDLFAPRCTPHLSHLSEKEAGPLNGVCYMWWDEFPCIALPGDPHFGLLHESALSAMEGIVCLASVACQESALHGLGHWQHRHKDRVSQIIDRFLQTNPGLDPRLVTYAHSARCGCVL